MTGSLPKKKKNPKQNRLMLEFTIAKVGPLNVIITENSGKEEKDF